MPKQVSQSKYACKKPSTFIIAIETKVKGNTAFVELFMSYPYVWHAYMHSSLMKFLCVCATSFFEDFYIKSFTNALVPLNKTEQSTSGLEALFRHTKNVRKKHWQTIGKAKRKTKYADIVLKRLYNTVDVASTFESLITHGWTRLKILRNGSHYRSWSNSNYQQAIGPRGSVEYKQHILLSDRSSK